MTDRLRIFDRKGNIKLEISASVKRSYILSNRGTAQFTIATNQSYVVEENFQYGNWVLIESTNKPVWVGTIASRVWGYKTLTITAHSPEFLLSQRIGDIETLVEGSAGQIFSEIIAQANKGEKTILKPGEIFNGDDRQETINPTQLNVDLRRIQERSQEEYLWRADFNSKGNLIVLGDWYKKAGNNLTFVLRESAEGGNIELVDERILVEDAPDGNYILGYGNGLSWLSKPIGYAQDDTSISKYGLIQKSISYYSVKNIDPIVRNAYSQLQKDKYPSQMFNVKATDSATYPHIGLGNTVGLELESTGFTYGQLGTFGARVRIKGIIFDPQDGEKLDLALQRIYTT